MIAVVSAFSTGGVASDFVASLLFSVLVDFFVTIMHLLRARFVLARQRTICAAPAGSVTYLAGEETSSQFATGFGKSLLILMTLAAVIAKQVARSIAPSCGEAEKPKRGGVGSQDWGAFV